MNFEILDDKWFKVDGNVFRRVYKININTDKSLQIYNAKDGSILFKRLEISNIEILGTATSIEALQEVILKTDCKKRNRHNYTEVEKKIFDLSFDETFE